MFKPSPILGARLRLTTKQVNGGYYKGNRTGSMGAHDSYGGYLIDYRKTRHFNCPNLTDFPVREAEYSGEVFYRAFSPHVHLQQLMLLLVNSFCDPTNGANQAHAD